MWITNLDDIGLQDQRGDHKDEEAPVIEIAFLVSIWAL